MKHLNMFHYFCPLQTINECIQREEKHAQVIYKDAEYNRHSHQKVLRFPQKDFPSGHLNKQKQALEQTETVSE